MGGDPRLRHRRGGRRGGGGRSHDERRRARVRQAGQRQRRHLRDLPLRRSGHLLRRGRAGVHRRPARRQDGRIEAHQRRALALLAAVRTRRDPAARIRPQRQLDGEVHDRHHRGTRDGPQRLHEGDVGQGVPMHVLGGARGRSALHEDVRGEQGGGVLRLPGGVALVLHRVGDREPVHRGIVRRQGVPEQDGRGWGNADGRTGRDHDL
mmetsp:Transcript_528/g.1207  ORF Transcript_528/g.1207 Transcript_528/m.1207 type:complete len:208 (+) Transcript_528:353-976(+)